MTVLWIMNLSLYRTACSVCAYILYGQFGYASVLVTMCYKYVVFIILPILRIPCYTDLAHLILMLLSFICCSRHRQWHLKSRVYVPSGWDIAQVAADVACLLPAPPFASFSYPRFSKSAQYRFLHPGQVCWSHSFFSLHNNLIQIPVQLIYLYI